MKNNKIKRTLSFLLSLVLICTMMYIGTVVSAAESVSYIDESGEIQELSEYFTVNDSSATWNDGWYVVDRDIIFSERITVGGTVRLILMDELTLTANYGISVLPGNSLYIYGQSDETGSLIAKADQYYAGIGGDHTTYSAGSIVINGGNISVQGGNFAAGIGGGDYGNGGTITINGGNVSAIGGVQGAGIGGGNANRNNDENIGGNGGNILINGGKVKAESIRYGAGIGGGCEGYSGNIVINGGEITAKGGRYASGIGGGYEGGSENIIINGGIITASGVTEDFEGGAGIGGGYSGNIGNITINGGLVTATGGKDGPGIGNGGECNELTDSNVDNIININGGVVIAEGGESAAGIGGGSDSYIKNIIVTGGTIISSSGKNAYGIGCGLDSSKTGLFSTGNDGHAVIYTDSVSDTLNQDSWSGIISSSSTIGPATVYGTPNINTDAEIPNGKTAIIEDGKTVTIATDTAFTNNGTIYQDYGSTFTKKGTYIENGTLYYEIKDENNSGINFCKGTVNYLEKNYAVAGNSVVASNNEKLNDGWKLVSYSVTAYDNSIVNVENLEFTMPNQPVAVAVIRTDEPFTLSYNANGLEGTVPNSITITADLDNSLMIGDAPGLSHFVTWNTSADGSGKEYKPGDTITLTSNITLYAQSGHNLEHVNAKDANCTENGNIEYWYCTACNEKFADPNAEQVITDEDVIIYAYGHNYTIDKDYVIFTWENDDFVNISSISCTAVFTCTDCGTKSDIVSCTVSHNTSTDHEATCTEMAEYDVIATATIDSPRNGSTIKATEAKHIEGVELGHDFKYVLINEATCITGNLYEITCSRCDYKDTTEDTELNPGNHAVELRFVEAKLATETEPGNIAYWICDACGKMYAYIDGNVGPEIDDVIIPATGAETNVNQEVDKDALREKLAEAEDLFGNVKENPKISEDLLNDLESAINHAKEVLDNENATQEEVDQTVQDLQDAMDAITLLINSDGNDEENSDENEGEEWQETSVEEFEESLEEDEETEDEEEAEVKTDASSIAPQTGASLAALAIAMGTAAAGIVVVTRRKKKN